MYFVKDIYKIKLNYLCLKYIPVDKEIVSFGRLLINKSEEEGIS